jgi:hypothetical protein
MTVDEAIICLSDMKIKIAIPKAAVQARLNNDALNMAIEALRCSEIPNNWIPCSERLPKESRKYLVTVFDGIGKRTTSAPYHRRSKSWTLTGRMAYWKVIAWMPLPEPYQKGEQE